MAPQLTGTKGPSRRGPDSWMSFATNSLPVPDSPEMCTGAWLRATRAIISRRCCMAADVPSKRGPKTLVSPSLVSDSLMAVATSLRRPARSKGLETKSKAPALSARTAVSMLPCAVITATGTRGRVLLDPSDQIEPVAVGQLHVGETQIEALGLEHALGLGNAVGGARTQIHALERDGQQFAQVRFVVDHQYCRLRHGSIVASAHRARRYSSQRCGSLNTTLKTLPPPLRGS